MSKLAIALPFLALVAGGCLHPGDRDECPDVEGTYTITQHCEGDFVGDTFAIIQDGCDIEVPLWSFEGSISSDGTTTMQGTPDDDALTCNGPIVDGHFVMDCSPNGCHVEGRLAAGGGGQVDDPCTDASACSLVGATCDDVGDGVTRCEAACTGNEACGGRGQCLFDSGEETGLCWRTCSSPSDCANGTWNCDQLVTDSTQGYCVLASGSP
jgi:hypothetical protein